ncbi:MAG: radical SAM protein [Anaerotruncus sp.]|nr:radical SAM protein [Anaerotruncus sp.]
MRDYVKEIAELLDAGERVILYSVGGDTLNILRALKQRFDRLPTALCDHDARKQNQTFQGLYGMCVSSAQFIISEYPDAFWFISTLDYKFQIIGELTDVMKISPDKIINYEPVVKKRSCAYLEKSLVCDEHRQFSFCWYQPAELPAVAFSGSYKDSFERLFQLRDKTIDAYNQECGNCSFLCTDYYPVERKLRWINYGVGGVCNFDCMYCHSNARIAKSIDYKTPKLPEILAYLKEHDMLAEDYGINIAPGEPTVHPEKEQLFGAMDCYSNVVNTNLAVFNEQLFRLTAENFTKLVVSIDSGTPETFEKVKGRDYLGRVCENLKRYSAAGFGVIVLKYVFIPGVNDNEKDVDGFAQICLETGCLIGNISYDYNAPLPIPERTVAMMKRLRDNFQRLHLLCTSNIVYSASDYVKELKKSVE